VYAAVLLDNGRVNLHLIINDPESERDSRIFPSVGDDKDPSSAAAAASSSYAGDNDVKITSMVLTAEFLIYVTNRGSVHHFFLKDWAQVVEHRHEAPLTAVYSNPLGTRLVLTDTSSRAWLYSPVDDHKFEIAGYPAANGAEKVLFDQTDPNTFVVADTKHARTLTTFAYASQTTRGPAVQKLPQVTKLNAGFAHAVLCYDGQIHGQKASGAFTSLALASHDNIHHAQQPFKGRGGRSSDRLRSALTQLLSLNRLKQAWELALLLKSRDAWSQLAKKALEQLDIDMSIRCYRELKDTAMVLALQEIRGVEDKDLLAGHLLLLQGDYASAQKLFLASSQPVQALQMRRDLLNWDMALKLAAQLAPAEIPSICREYAASLEVKGDYQQALAMYQRAIQEDAVSAAERAAGGSGGAEVNPALSKEHLRVCNGGVTRMTLRVGDLQRGRSLALASGDKLLMKDCAAILEQMKQYPDAADMYVVAEQYERAASIYNQTMQFAKSAPLMDKITTPKIHLQYAKAKEVAKEYAVAAVAYEKARDLDSVIRLNLQYLDNPDKAFQIVRQTKSAEGAALVADYCRQHNNFQAAIEFLLLAKRGEEALSMAKAHAQMPAYCAALGDDGTQAEYAQVAAYFEEARDWARAGEYYARIGDYPRAIKLYLSSDNPAHIDAAIGVVKKAQGQPGSELLVRQLHDHLLGESDGKVKDLNYIFRLYMAIGEYEQAATTAILIATQEQTVGQYAVAHGILFAMYQDLVRERLTIPAELRRNLVLLHSYTLAKKMTAAKQHDHAARMLIRVAKSISKFPAHVVPILTSTVIECQRAGLKKDSLEYAKILLRPEHKPKVSPQFLKPIESFVRRPPSQEELDKERGEKSTPCPYCDFDLPESVLHCPSCKNDLPYCVTTGRHMVLQDWSECPSCAFPTLYSAAVNYFSSAADKSCCMCNAPVALADLRKLSEQQARAKLTRPAAAGEDKDAAAAAAAGGEGEGPPAARQGGMMAGGAQQQRGPQPLAAVDIEPIFNKK
jgi:WD repeat-containing protein 19